MITISVDVVALNWLNTYHRIVTDFERYIQIERERGGGKAVENKQYGVVRMRM